MHGTLGIVQEAYLGMQSSSGWMKHKMWSNRNTPHGKLNRRHHLQLRLITTNHKAEYALLNFTEISMSSLSPSTSAKGFAQEV